MEHRRFVALFLCILTICIVLTLIHLAYAVYAYQHCSIIQFIAKELW